MTSAVHAAARIPPPAVARRTQPGLGGVLLLNHKLVIGSHHSRQKRDGKEVAKTGRRVRSRKNAAPDKSQVSTVKSTRRKNIAAGWISGFLHAGEKTTPRSP